MIKVNNKTPERHWRRFGVFIVNFEYIPPCFFYLSIANFDHLFVCWVGVFLVSSLLDTEKVFIHNAQENYKNFFKNSHPKGYSVMKIPANFSKNKMRP